MGKEIEMLILFNFLAERSMQSINEISMFVETVEKNTGEAVDLTKRVLQKIIASVNMTSQLVNDVFTTTEEQKKQRIVSIKDSGEYATDHTGTGTDG